MAELPSGTVTFLFTDIEGSTRLLKQLRERYGQVLGQHQVLLREAFAANGGEVIDTQGDSFFVVFRRPKQAIAAAAEAQRALAGHQWPEGAPLRVRMGIHTGEAELEEGRYHGVAVHRAARIGAAGHGGQVLLSQTTHDVLHDEEAEQLGVGLRDLGLQRLKDLDRPVRLYQLVIEGLPSKFPSLKTLGRVREGNRRRGLLAAALMGVIAAAVAIPIFALGQGGSGGGSLEEVSANSVGVIDAAGNKITHEVQVGVTPTAVAAGKGSIWVTNADAHSVSRIDPITNAVVQTIAVGNGPAGIAYGGGFVWVANSLDGTVSQIDPLTNGVVQKIPVGNGPAGVAYGEGAVWVANSDDWSVTRIDPHSGAVHTFSVPAGADGIAVGARAVWVTSESAGSVARLDPRSGAVQNIRVGSGPAAVAVGGGFVWVANSLEGTVSKIDPRTNLVVRVIPVEKGPSGLAVAPDGSIVWVSNELAGMLSRIDPDRDKVVRTVTIGNRPQGVAATGDAMYVAVQTSGRAHRGGTLTLVAKVGDFNTIDPVELAGQNAPYQTLFLTNDGLTGYKHAGGRDGLRLVPDLATSLPSPTDGGRTYTFQLRSGIRYSSGQLVRPEDFRRALERAHAGGAFSGIAGAAACLKTPKKRCDLSKGIVADPGSNTVTFHLSAPDPDFLAKLAFPVAFAVPASTPDKARLPLPATGPYRIASYDPKRGVRLARNPRFYVWSQAAQPSGFPDQVVWRLVKSPEAEARVVERGRADYANLIYDFAQLAPARQSELRTRYASQLHVNPQLRTDYVFLNTRLPPFNDVRVRRAVNFAVDRNRFVALYGGPDFAQASCQVLPPNLQGYKPYCPYTLDRSPTGAPDLARARALVAASGTKGQAVTVFGGPAAGAYLASVLRSLGYKARFKLADERYFATAGDSRRRIQAGIHAWILDYPLASDFFVPLFTCASFHPRTSDNFNFAEFCNRRIDAEIARAHSLQTSDPHAASKLWSKIDRDVTDQAPWVVRANLLSIDFVSRRVGNYIYNPYWGALLDQLWVR